MDTITDFTHAEDKIDLIQLFGEDMDLNWAGTTPTEYSVWFKQPGDGNTYVYADINGTPGTPELAIKLIGPHELTVNDFVGVVEPTLSIDDVSVDEDDCTITFTVTKSDATLLATSVDYMVTPGTAEMPQDYAAGTSPLSGTLTFAAGETTKTITLTLTDDALDEINETLEVSLSNAVNSKIADEPWCWHDRRQRRDLAGDCG